jgi:pyridoxine 4-dehydrogenase
MRNTTSAREFHIAGKKPVRRLGFGAMRITGSGIWGEPPDHGEAVRVVRRAVELGINFIDTADSYGPEVSERIIAEALHPYPPGLVIATKAGFVRPGPNQWTMNGRPEHLRTACEGSLRRLRLDRIILFQLHRIDPNVPAADQLGALERLQAEGKIEHIGLSEVSISEIENARAIVPIVSVQNRYSVADRAADDVVDYCTRENLAFIPWYPLATGKLEALDRKAAKLSVTPSQLALAWLLWRSPAIIPIPGTSNIKHLEENTAASSLKLDERELESL